MRLPLVQSLALASLVTLVACGGGKTMKKPSWTGTSSGIYDEDGKWYYGIEKASGSNKLQRRLDADKKAKENVVAACKDVKAEDAEVVDHFVDDSGAEFALARVDGGKCPDAAQGGASGAAKPAADAKAEAKPEEKKEEAKPAEGEAKAAEEKPAEEAKPAEEKPAEEAK